MYALPGPLHIEKVLLELQASELGTQGQLGKGVLVGGGGDIVVRVVSDDVDMIILVFKDTFEVIGISLEVVLMLLVVVFANGGVGVEGTLTLKGDVAIELSRLPRQENPLPICVWLIELP